MKLARFHHKDRTGVGVVRGQQLFPLPKAFGDDLIGVAADWPDARPCIEQAVADAAPLALTDVHLLSPIGRPGKIMAIGLNYADHIAESKLEWPKTQTWFAKHLTSLNGPFDPVEIPRVSDAVDYEAELVAVIGRKGRHIAAEDAPGHVFGYCVGNDVSVRDWQKASTQWVTGKSFDTHAPIGPWLTTADEIGDPHRLGLRCFVNGELRQNSNTRELVFNLWDQIAYVSQAMTLLPGDILFTGTPGGVGFSFSPKRKLRDGDRVRVEIDELGAIENICADER